MPAKDLTCECGALTSGKCPGCNVSPLCDACKKQDGECAECAMEDDFTDDEDEDLDEEDLEDEDLDDEEED